MSEPEPVFSMGLLPFLWKAHSVWVYYGEPLPGSPCLSIQYELPSSPHRIRAIDVECKLLRHACVNEVWCKCLSSCVRIVETQMRDLQSIATVLRELAIACAGTQGDAYVQTAIIKALIRQRGHRCQWDEAPIERICIAIRQKSSSMLYTKN